MKLLKVTGDGETARPGYHRQWVAEVTPQEQAMVLAFRREDGTPYYADITTAAARYGWFAEGSAVHAEASAAVDTHNAAVSRRHNALLNRAFSLSR